MADPKKHAHPHMCYLVERGRSALKGVAINRQETQKIGIARLHLGMGAWLTPKNKPPPHMCYHVKFGSSASNSVCINRRNPKIGKCWDPAP